MPGSDKIRAAIKAIQGPISFNLAFWSDGAWDSGDPDSSIINDIRATGGDAIISFGGSYGCGFNKEPALLGGTVDQVVARYLEPIIKYGFRHIDLDIEGGKESDTTSFQLRNKALKIVQDQTGIQITFTVPADESGIYCTKMLQDAKQQGIKISTIRVMLMDFGHAVNMVDTCINGLRNTYAQIWAVGLGDVRLGFIPLLGVDDGSINTYTLQNHIDILAKCKSLNFWFVYEWSFWEITRDKDYSFLKEYNKITI